jgi:hypothetical protein
MQTDLPPGALLRGLHAARDGLAVALLLLRVLQRLLLLALALASLLLFILFLFQNVILRHRLDVVQQLLQLVLELAEH